MPAAVSSKAAPAPQLLSSGADKDLQPPLPPKQPLATSASAAPADRAQVHLRPAKQPSAAAQSAAGASKAPLAVCYFFT